MVIIRKVRGRMKNGVVCRKRAWYQNILTGNHKNDHTRY